MKKTEQIDFWLGKFGQEYTDRNTPENLQLWNEDYFKTFGVARFDMLHEFLSGLDKEAKILEVGCNTGLQLGGLQQMGFKNLYGVDLQQYAIEKSKSMWQGINIIQGSAFELPFKTDFFDLVFTNGVLIHIAPDDLSKALAEIVRCSAKFVMGFEYFSEESTQMNYRGNEGFLWKMNYEEVYKTNFPELKTIKEKKYPYITEAEKGKVDSMFLLEKK